MKQLENWEHVDAALRRMGELKIRRDEIDGRKTLKVNEITAQAKEKIAPLDAEIAELEKDIETFCRANPEAFFEKRSMKLDFGKVGFRVVAGKLVYRSASAAVAVLKAMKLLHCIKTTEAPVDSEVKKLDKNTLAKIGAACETEDTFRAEPDLKKIREAEKQ